MHQDVKDDANENFDNDIEIVKEAKKFVCSSEEHLISVESEEKVKVDTEEDSVVLVETSDVEEFGSKIREGQVEMELYDVEVHSAETVDINRCNDAKETTSKEPMAKVDGVNKTTLISQGMQEGQSKHQRLSQQHDSQDKENTEDEKPEELTLSQHHGGSTASKKKKKKKKAKKKKADVRDDETHAQAKNIGEKNTVMDVLCTKEEDPLEEAGTKTPECPTGIIKQSSAEQVIDENPVRENGQVPSDDVTNITNLNVEPESTPKTGGIQIHSEMISTTDNLTKSENASQIDKLTENASLTDGAETAFKAGAGDKTQPTSTGTIRETSELKTNAENEVELESQGRRRTLAYTPGGEDFEDSPETPSGYTTNNDSFKNCVETPVDLKSVMTGGKGKKKKKRKGEFKDEDRKAEGKDTACKDSPLIKEEDSIEEACVKNPESATEITKESNTEQPQDDNPIK